MNKRRRDELRKTRFLMYTLDMEQVYNQLCDLCDHYEMALSDIAENDAAFGRPFAIARAALEKNYNSEAANE